MGHSAHDPAVKGRPAWNAGRKLGAKRALKPQQVWAVRFWLDRERRTRDRAMFDLAIDSMTTVWPHAKQGTVRPLGVSTPCTSPSR